MAHERLDQHADGLSAPPKAPRERSVVNDVSLRREQACVGVAPRTAPAGQGAFGVGRRNELMGQSHQRDRDESVRTCCST